MNIMVMALVSGDGYGGINDGGGGGWKVPMEGGRK